MHTYALSLAQTHTHTRRRTIPERLVDAPPPEVGHTEELDLARVVKVLEGGGHRVHVLRLKQVCLLNAAI